MRWLGESRALMGEVRAFSGALGALESLAAAGFRMGLVTAGDRPVVELRVPAGDGALLARIHRESEVLSTRSDDTEMVLTVRASGSELERLRALGAR